MKYLFAAIAFFSIGYVMPTFPSPLQLGLGLSVFTFLVVALYYYLDTRVLPYA